jgi:hypothetical protein
MVTIEHWKKRRNYRIFDNSVEPDDILVETLDTCLNSTPIQNGAPILLLKLRNTVEDRMIKDFLTEKYFTNKFGRHMVAVASAPLVYIAICNPYYEDHPDDDENVATRAGAQATLHGGALMAATLEEGWDFSFIGCSALVDEAGFDPKIEGEWRDMVRERFKIELHSYPWPMVSFCIGRGINDAPADVNELDSWKDYELTNGNIVRYQPLESRSEISKKPNIIS